ncbi:hypothetical protein [Zoogloea sp.]|uniref:hypothetical protein n=1 Tax=Zoogloea sp. TaxID=49181 RepID=UPI0032207B85
MATEPTENSGIIATNIAAKAIAVGPNSTATNYETSSDVSSRLDELAGLVEALKHLHPTLPEGQVARRMVAEAVKGEQQGDKKAISDSIGSIVSIFKSIGDTVTASQKIVEVAQGILAIL